jgi:hypothetical protein
VERETTRRIRIGRLTHSDVTANPEQRQPQQRAADGEVDREVLRDVRAVRAEQHRRPPPLPDGERLGERAGETTATRRRRGGDSLARRREAKKTRS